MKIEANGIELFYEVKGVGEPLLLLHGNGEDHTIFGPLAEKLSRHFTIYAPDSRNHGLSARNEDYSYDAMARDVTAFVEELRLENVSVVGFSDGAIIAMLAQISRPGTFSRMALLGPNLSPGDFIPEIYSEMEREWKKNGDPLLELMLTQPDIRPEQLAGIDIPVLVVGAQDDIYKPETFERIDSALPDSRLMIVEGHDHGSYILGNDMMYGPLMEFLG